MLQLEIERNGDLTIVHRDASPTVYLDHWAVRKIAASHELVGRFTGALKSRDGTLAISWVNLVEYTKVTLEKTAHEAKCFLDASMPNVFFIDPEFFDVIRREDEFLKHLSEGKHPPGPPHGDEPVAREFAVMSRESPNPLAAGNLFRMMRSDKLVERFERLADTGCGSHREAAG